jgi:dethiobiotin synthetase
MSGLFITGVGTGVGKTLVTTILCHQLREMGRRVIALKPVVSGHVEGDPDGDPALILRSLGIEPTTEAVAAIAPWRFAAPVSPHLAALREGRSVSRDEVVRFCREPAGDGESIRLIEGAGGVMSPLTSDATCLDLIADLGVPAILVTGTYLGSLSHTLTSLAALKARAATVRGIVVSESAESVGLLETVESLRAFGGADVPIYSLPRLAGEPPSRWRQAPPLTSLCEPDHARTL